MVISYAGKTRRFDLDIEGRLSFAHVAKVFKLSAARLANDEWTLDDTNLRIDASAELMSLSNLRDLFPLPAGTAAHPLVLNVEDAGPSPACGSAHKRGTPGRSGLRSSSVLSPPGGRVRNSPATRAAAAAASPRPAGVSTPGPSRRGAELANCSTPTAASPLRGARTPVAMLPPPAPTPSGRGLPRHCLIELARPPAPELLRHPAGQGSFFLPASAAQHLPMLSACHLAPPHQRLLRGFGAAAQRAIVARAMALYAGAAGAEHEYFGDGRLESALTEARSSNPPQDRYSAYTQAARLTGRKRKPTGTTTPGTAARAAAAAEAGAGASTAAAAGLCGPAGGAGGQDVDMDRGSVWSFAGGGTVHCPGGVAARRPGRHENWQLSDATGEHVTYLPVLYDSEEHSAVLLPLEGGRSGGSTAARGARAELEEGPVTWFRYEYESRAGRRGHNFWDSGLAAHLEAAVTDVAGPEALLAAMG
ncbi:hypothetical protein HYH03_009791 [Edaphochlamys debaryana]|uniref:Uncharacterized protein n=1 Tax=Edaphochlamys debaryana TaxID=47281 RepID=A0A835XXX7_9CHLO|nr:hypothetical protein HYH03_009791 [Edaphochlamys debaryana]|eukprot:KAG2491834.1 hypothetical protein HYH03_009791 [Edaphochlamys debaryana]